MKFQKYPFLALLLVTTGLLAQSTMTLEERNQLIRDRWNRSLVDDTSYTFNKEANNLLAQTIEGVKTGKALCVAMGQGRNALFLARNGWQVSGFDLADRAVAQAEEQAREEGLELTTYIESFERFDFGQEEWDLITWLYGGCLNVDNIASKIHSGLKKGGLFVFEFFHREAGIEMDRPKFGCPADTIRNLFEQQGGFEILLYEEKPGIADYGMDKHKLIYMVLSKR